MFALGCIIFKIVTGQMLFPNDWGIWQWARQGRTDFTWPDSRPGSQLSDLGVLARNLLAIEPPKRPGAVETRDFLYRIRTGLEPERNEGLTSDPFFYVEDGVHDTVPNPAATPTVQPALRFMSKHKPGVPAKPEPRIAQTLSKFEDLRAAFSAEVESIPRTVAAGVPPTFEERRILRQHTHRIEEILLQVDSVEFPADTSSEEKALLRRTRGDLVSSINAVLVGIEQHMQLVTLQGSSVSM